jgi:phosphoribosylformylglycinamidine synthase
MIHFFGSQETVFALQTQDNLSNEDIKKLLWLFNSQIDNKFTITNIIDSSLKAYFVGLVQQ